MVPQPLSFAWEVEMLKSLRDSKRDDTKNESDDDLSAEIIQRLHLYLNNNEHLMKHRFCFFDRR